MTTHSSILAWKSPMDRGAWWATVHRVVKSRIRLKHLNTHTHTYIYFFFKLFSHLGYYSILSRVPCVIQQVLLACCCYCLVIKSCLILLQPHGLQLERLLCPWDLPGKRTGMCCHFLLQGELSDSGIEAMSPALAGGFFTTEPPGKPSLWLIYFKYSSLYSSVQFSCSVVSDSLRPMNRSTPGLPVCTCQSQIASLSLPPALPPSNHKFIL